MPMNREDLLNAIIDDGITEVLLAYQRPDQKQKRDGAVAAFEACRMKSDKELLVLMENAREEAKQAMHGRAEDYWWHRMYELQVEWTLNVLSAAMYANDMTPIINPTQRGMNKAIDILGIKN